MHWVALYDFLGEDHFDGLLGEDDWEYPRILLEYSIIGGKFTSVVNNLEQVKDQVSEMQGGGQTDKGPQAMKIGQKGNKKERGYIEEEKGDFTCSIEF